MLSYAEVAFPSQSAGFCCLIWVFSVPKWFLGYKKMLSKVSRSADRCLCREENNRYIWESLLSVKQWVGFCDLCVPIPRVGAWVPRQIFLTNLVPWLFSNQLRAITWYWRVTQGHGRENKISVTFPTHYARVHTHVHAHTPLLRAPVLSPHIYSHMWIDYSCLEEQQFQ